MGDGGLSGARGLVVPEDPEAERAVLAACLLDDGSEGVVWRVRALVKPEDFADRARSEAYGAMLAVADRGEVLDVVTLAGELRARGRLNAVGGPQYIGEITDEIPTTAHVESHARLVADAATRRRVLESSSRLAARASSGAPIGDLQGAARELLELSTATGEDDVVPLGRAAQEEEDRYAATGAEGVISTGLRVLDTALAGGLWDGQTVVIGGRPSDGKSALGAGFATAGARWCASRGEGVVVYLSVEMPRRALAARAACEAIARATPDRPVDLMRVRAKTLETDDLRRYTDALQALDALPLFISDRRDITPSRARALCLRLRARHGKVALVVVDYLQKMEPDQRHESREREVAETSRTFSALAGELKCPVVLLSQLNRDAAKRRPTMADLRESGAVENDADVILLLHREGGKRDVDLVKQRDGAISDGPIPLGWCGPAACFTDPAESTDTGHGRWQGPRGAAPEHDNDRAEG
jgi:replicative DNA helicase